MHTYIIHLARLQLAPFGKLLCTHIFFILPARFNRPFAALSRAQVNVL